MIELLKLVGKMNYKRYCTFSKNFLKFPCIARRPCRQIKHTYISGDISRIISQG